MVTRMEPHGKRPGVVGVPAEEFLHEVDADLEWRGIAEISTDGHR